METIGETRSARGLAERQEAHPAMKVRIERLLDMVENVRSEIKRADGAEQRAINELRGLGQELLETWGQRLADSEGKAVRRVGEWSIR